MRKMVDRTTDSVVEDLLAGRITARELHAADLDDLIWVLEARQEPISADVALAFAGRVIRQQFRGRDHQRARTNWIHRPCTGSSLRAMTRRAWLLPAHCAMSSRKSYPTSPRLC